jgi:hypothetical protein
VLQAFQPFKLKHLPETPIEPENISQAIANGLRRRGIDATTELYS